MKRVGYLYEKIYDIDNCRQAIIEAADDKRKRRRVKYILEHLDEYAGKLSKMIKNKVSLKKIRKVVSKHETGIQRKTISNVAGNSKC